jgi:ketosteroid isomerase-like protein
MKSKRARALIGPPLALRPGGQEVNDVYQINLAKTAFREAYANADVDQLLSVFAPGGFTDMSEGLPSKYGEEARTTLRARAEKLFAKYSVKLNCIIIDISVQGGTAYDFGWHEWILTPKNGGTPVLMRHRYFELWSKDVTDAWKIALFANNLDVREELGESRSRWFLSEERPALLVSCGQPG